MILLIGSNDWWKCGKQMSSGRKKTKQVVTRKLFKQYETANLNLNVSFKQIHPLYLSFASPVNMSLLFSVFSDSSYLLIKSDGNIPLALSLFSTCPRQQGYKNQGNTEKLLFAWLYLLPIFTSALNLFHTADFNSNNKVSDMHSMFFWTSF